MKKITILFCCFFLTYFILWAQVHAYEYNIYSNTTTRPLNISNESFRRYAIPQLRSIVAEYYHILRKVEPIQGGLIEIKRDIMKLDNQVEEYLKACRKMTLDCQQQLREFYRKALSIDKKIGKFYNSLFSAKNLTKERLIDKRLRLSKKLDVMSNISLEIVHLFQLTLISFDTEFYSPLYMEEKLHPLLHRMRLISRMIIVGQTNEYLLENFYLLLQHYITPIEEHVIYFRDKKYLISNLGDLNVIWNTFHLRIAKEKNALPKKLTSIIKIMHNRWNSILKIILK